MVFAVSELQQLDDNTGPGRRMVTLMGAMMTLREVWHVVELVLAKIYPWSCTSAAELLHYSPLEVIQYQLQSAFSILS